MMIQFEDEFFYQLKDACMIEFLKDDLDTIIKTKDWDLIHPDDIKESKKLIKAYNRILKYYGVNNG